MGTLMVIVKTYKMLETNTGVQMLRDPRHHSSASKVKMGFFVSHSWNNKLQRQYIYTFIRHEDRIQHTTEIKTDRQTDRQTNITTNTST